MSWGFEFKTVHDRRYLYLIEKQRTPKGPRNVQQIYVGNAETLLRKLATPGEPLKSFEFGKMAALVHAATETGLLDAFRRFSPRGVLDVYSVEHLLFLQLAARVDKPLSRDGMGEWLNDSILPFVLPATHHPSPRTLRRYLKRLYGNGEKEERGEGILSRAVTHRIEEHVFQTLLAKGIDPSWLLFDTTNFFAHHEADDLFQRGHSKEKRYDKNLVGLGLVTLGNLPVLTEIYPGNEGDARVFSHVFDTLVKRLLDLEVATERLIMVFDRGINSEENFGKVREAMHVIAALNRHQAQRLFRTPIEKFTQVATDAQGKPVLGFPDRWSGFEEDWRVLVTYREATAAQQAKTWEDVQSRVLAQVEVWRKHPSGKEKALWRRLTALIPRAFQAEFDVQVEEVPVMRRGKPGKGYLPRVRVIPQAEARLKASFGKTAIITDLEAGDLPDEKLVEGFVMRSQLEEDFRWLKDRYVVSVKPFWVWHDATVPGHVFLCVMGLLLLRYLQWELRDDPVSMKELVEGLERIKVVLTRTPEGKPRLVLERMGREEGRLFTRLNLTRFIPA
ncbi:MAG: IS1634 family transposase [Nitrososphaerota archaeon]|jgi:transposase|nr:IS1634 family transposase [Nitrososphaerota archaeon]